MISSASRKIFSALAITYAFASSSVMAEDDLLKKTNERSDEVFFEVENNEENKIDTKEIAKKPVGRVVPFEDQNFLNISFEDGESLYWTMEHGFSIFETVAPFGMNEKGLVVETEVNDFANTYITEINDRATKMKSNDLPSWLLSKYSTVDEIKNNIENVMIVKESNDQSLSYFVTDKTDNITIEVKDSRLRIV